MKNAKTKIFMLILAIALLVGMTTAFTVVAGAESVPAEVSIDYCNLSFKESVYIKYAVKSNTPDVSLLIWREAKDDYVYGTQATEIKDYYTDTIDGEEYYVFDYKDLSAKEMGDVVYARAYANVGGTAYYSDVEKYSVLQYVYNWTGKTGPLDTDTDFVAMLNNMLIYGASAQQYFDYKTDRLATMNFYQVAVNGGLLSDKTADGLYLPGDKVVITAPETNSEGGSFSHWVDSDGKKIEGGATAEIEVGTKNETYTPVYAQSFAPIAGRWIGKEIAGYTTNSYEIIIGADGTVTASYTSSYSTVEMTINSVTYDGNTLTINYTAFSTTADMVFVISEDNASMTTDSAAASYTLTVKKTYKVTFDFGEYTSAADVVKDVTWGETTSAQSKSWTGHTLDAWLLDGEVFDFSTPITSDITLVAKWSVKVSTVTFLDQNGNAIKEIEVEYNQYVSAEDLPTDGIITKEGYTFNGKWYTSTTSTSPVNFTSSKISSDKTYYPGIIIPMNDIAGTWNGTDSKGNVYEMVVDAENADIDLTITSSAGVADNVTIEVILYRTEAKLVIRYFAQGKTTATTLTLNYQADGTFTGSNSLVLEKEGAVSYTVAFDSNGGSEIAAQTIAKGGTANLPAAPTKDGFIFAYWTLDGEEFDFATEISSDITLVAEWTTAYTVTFDKGSSQTEVLVAADATVAKPADPSKSNYTFLYWAIDGEEFDFETPITEDITLTAVFKGKDVTLAFYNQNKVLVENVTVEYGTVIDESLIPEAVMNDGFIFTGVWHKSYTASAAPFDLTAPITITSTQKLYPGFMTEEAYMMEGTWTGSTDTETYTFNISFEDGKPVITVSVETEDGVTEYVVVSMQYEATGVAQLKYFKEGSTSASSFKLTYDAESDTLTFNTKSISLERA